VEYEDIFEMLEAVRAHKLGKGESLVPTSSVRGTHVGFATADTKGPATRWTISMADLKRSCEARTSDEAPEVLRRMRAYQERRKLIADLRAGKFVLEERPAPDTEDVVLEEPTPRAEAERFFREAEADLPEGRTGLAQPGPDEPEEDNEVEGFLDMLQG
jgi:hypothetical protein